MNKNIAIIGAGWYGCHFAKILIEKGHRVTIYEKNGSVFSAASGANQNRLHLGFHYPRDFATRKQSSDGFSWFMKNYKNFTLPICKNYYAIPQHGSILDSQTYLQIMTASGLPYERICVDNLKSFSNLDAIINTNERLILNNFAASYFEKLLEKNINYNTEISDEGYGRILDEYDFVIDCTWGALLGESMSSEIYYEACIYFIYQSNESDFALTVMDGPFTSLFPYYDDFFTLTDVEHTPIFSSQNFKEVNEYLCSYKLQNHKISEKRKLFESKIKIFINNFDTIFTFVKPQFAVKTKTRSTSDRRTTNIYDNENSVHILSGKIDTIYVAENHVLERLNET